MRVYGGIERQERAVVVSPIRAGPGMMVRQEQEKWGGGRQPADPSYPCALVCAQNLGRHTPKGPDSCNTKRASVVARQSRTKYRACN